MFGCKGQTSEIPWVSFGEAAQNNVDVKRPWQKHAEQRMQTELVFHALHMNWNRAESPGQKQSGQLMLIWPLGSLICNKVWVCKQKVIWEYNKYTVMKWQTSTLPALCCAFSLNTEETSCWKTPSGAVNLYCSVSTVWPQPPYSTRLNTTHTYMHIILKKLKTYKKYT